MIVTVVLVLPELPVMVMVEAPGVAELLAVSVSVLVVVVLALLNDAVTPPGSPDAARATVPLKPFCGLTVIVLFPVPPAAIETLAGEAESV